MKNEESRTNADARYVAQRVVFARVEIRQSSRVESSLENKSFVLSECARVLYMKLILDYKNVIVLMKKRIQIRMKFMFVLSPY